MRAVVNSDTAPHPLDWCDPLYFNVSHAPFNDLSEQGDKWVEQLDMSTGNSVRLLPSVALASQVSPNSGEDR